MTCKCKERLAELENKLVATERERDAARAATLVEKEYAARIYVKYLSQDKRIISLTKKVEAAKKKLSKLDETRAAVWEEAAKLAEQEGDETLCMDCTSTTKLAKKFRGPASRGKT